MFDFVTMLLHYTDKEMMMIHISSKEARDLEKYFNITLPKSGNISAQTVMGVLRVQIKPSTDVQLLRMFAAAPGKKDRSRQIDALIEVQCNMDYSTICH